MNLIGILVEVLYMVVSRLNVALVAFLHVACFVSVMSAGILLSRGAVFFGAWCLLSGILLESSLLFRSLRLQEENARIVDDYLESVSPTIYDKANPIGTSSRPPPKVLSWHGKRGVS